MISLSEAIRDGRLDDFIAQEEARGIGPVDRNALDRAIAKLAKARRSGDRTSRSSFRDGSRGK